MQGVPTGVHMLLQSQVHFFFPQRMNTLINDNVLYSCHLSKVGVMLGDFHLKADHVDIHPIVLS